MAFKSSLRIRESLLWETSYNGCEKGSDTFSLDKSEHKIVIGPYFVDNSDYILVKLKRCYATTEQPFIVETFLQDKRSKERLDCCRINVSSDFEKIFQEKHAYVCKKLPGLKMYRELTIVLTFYPPTILLTVGKNSSNFRIQRSLVFETRLPDIRQEYLSPPFDLSKLSWNLTIRNVSTLSTLYQINLSNFSGIQFFEPFEVTTYIEDKRSRAQILCSNIIVTSSVEVLYKSDFISVFEQIPGLKRYDDLLIVCVFSVYTESTLAVKPDTGLKTECLDKSSFPNHLCDSETLSKDFFQFAEKNVLTDVQVRCGNEIMTAHKAVLAARSDVFLAKFQHMVERKNGVIDIPDVEPTVFKVFLKYLYSGQLPKGLSEDIVWKLYEASYKYAVPSLRKLCKWCMSRNVNTNNFIHYLKLANSHSDQQLTDAVANFVIERPSLMANATWSQFSQELPNVANEIYGKYMKKYVAS